MSRPSRALLVVVAVAVGVAIVALWRRAPSPSPPVPTAPPPSPPPPFPTAPPAPAAAPTDLAVADTPAVAAARDRAWRALVASARPCAVGLPPDADPMQHVRLRVTVAAGRVQSVERLDEGAHVTPELWGCVEPRLRAAAWPTDVSRPLTIDMMLTLRQLMPAR